MIFSQHTSTVPIYKVIHKWGASWGATRGPGRSHDQELASCGSRIAIRNREAGFLEVIMLMVIVGIGCN